MLDKVLNFPSLWYGFYKNVTVVLNENYSFPRKVEFDTFGSHIESTYKGNGTYYDQHITATNVSVYNHTGLNFDETIHTVNNHGTSIVKVNGARVDTNDPIVDGMYQVYTHIERVSGEAQEAILHHLNGTQVDNLSSAGFLPINLITNLAEHLQHSVILFHLPLGFLFRMAMCAVFTEMVYKTYKNNTKTIKSLVHDNFQ